MKLPPELRDKIYRYHLILPGRIKPTSPCNTSFVNQHYKNCLLGVHRWPLNNSRSPAHRRNSFGCTDPFVGLIQYFPIPESVLSILLVSRQINAEAMHIFYRFNDFVFLNVSSLHFWLDRIGTRYMCLGELSFSFSSGHARDVFLKLQNCPYLTKLHIEMRYNAPNVRLNKGRTLASATGMSELRKIRGIEVLDLVGQDFVEIPVIAGGPDRRVVGIMDATAIGPRLRRDLMTPRPDGS